MRGRVARRLVLMDLYTFKKHMTVENPRKMVNARSGASHLDWAVDN